MVFSLLIIQVTLNSEASSVGALVLDMDEPNSSGRPAHDDTIGEEQLIHADKDIHHRRRFMVKTGGRA
jgi:hypothetical protein